MGDSTLTGSKSDSKNEKTRREADVKAGRAVDRDPQRGSAEGPKRDNRHDVRDEDKADGEIHGGEQHEAPKRAKKPADAAPSRAHYANPVFVDAIHQRTDDDAMEGHAVDVIGGKHKGRFGVFWSVAEYGKDGYPVKVIVRTFDHQDGDEYVGVDFSQVRNSPPRNQRL